MGKLHLINAFRRYLTDWFPPLCAAIR